ncbi:nitrilase-related carbon-nitrogen hydrolase, partial [uncultured Cyclobacterium sp.]|uniref:nitrilase-related carbon-nitrogen hydrolase n=1 Tax=uncultured Cyclobacterium sp. TaxID=453820 RepID=UPI0030ED46CA
MDLKIASAQFENKSGDKEYNLNMIDEMSKKAAEEGADIIAFHECSITGYSFARKLTKDQMLDLSEYIPDGPSI